MSTVLTVLSYLGPAMGVLGFIVTPGLTVIYPWAKERFNKNRRDFVNKQISVDIDHMTWYQLEVELERLKKEHKLDWRPRIIKRKRAVKKAVENKIERYNKAINDIGKKAGGCGGGCCSCKGE